MNTDNTDSSRNTENTASARTVVDYTRQIKVHYEAVKNSIHNGVLSEPSNGNLRDVCKQLFLEGFKKEDENAVRQFFGVSQTENLKNVIDSEINSFRRVAKFLKGESQETDIKNLNLVAVLIDFDARPYPEFRKRGVQNRLENDNLSIRGDAKPVDATEAIKDKKSNRKGMIIVGVAAVVMMATAILNAAFFQKPSFMQWQTDHYAEVEDSAAATPDSPVYKWNEAEFGMKRIRVSDTTAFFKKGAPQYWYVQDNGYVFFDHPGKYPFDHKRELRPVSVYIAKKVQKGDIKIRY